MFTAFHYIWFAVAALLLWLALAIRWFSLFDGFVSRAMALGM